ncbi:hypothetical protein L1987_21632 [Smallanthus sonchifolius]|uniref:Uncharacterized protein n=1 Tax=Smallanthus sonchifolius TaxID=185202 RepID=A0ACB9ICD1_9ASTR|nr:hypothetical protein L1987_21632 [Smallanthus sonchifolius]
MAHFFGLSDEILSFIITILVTSADGAIHLAQLSATLVFMAENKQDLNERLEMWRAALEQKEMRMLRCMCGHTRLDRIRNEDFRARLGVARISDKISEGRLRWFGHVRRRQMTTLVRRVETSQWRGRGAEIDDNLATLKVIKLQNLKVVRDLLTRKEKLRDSQGQVYGKRWILVWKLFRKKDSSRHAKSWRLRRPGSSDLHFLDSLAPREGRELVLRDTRR